LNGPLGPCKLAIHVEPLKVPGPALAEGPSGYDRLANQLRMWGPAAFWAAVLFLLSAWPDPRGPDWLVLNDKVVHVALFTVLGGALGLGRLWSGIEVPHLLVLAVGALYGATDEWHQALVPRRTPSWGDWYADILGVMLGYALILFLSRRAAASADAANAGKRTD
jgi:VanZ family protein